MSNEPIDTLLNRDALISHANTVLSSDWSGVDIAKELEMNTRQVYAFRKGRRKISNATYDTLLKFERMYQEYFLEDSNKMKREDNNGRI